MDADRGQREHEEAGSGPEGQTPTASAGQGQGVPQALTREAGQGMHEPPPLPAPAIIADTPCIGCGYNVRSLELTSACPECGTAIAATLAGGLQFAPEAYLRKLLRATRMITVGMATYALAMVCVVVVGTLLSGGIEVLSNPTSGHVGGGVMLLTLLVTIPVVSMLTGLWLFTTPHPGLSEGRQARTSAMLTRVATGIAGIACLTTSAGAIVAATQTGSAANVMASLGMVMSCGSCAGVPLLLGLLLPPLGVVRWLAQQQRTDAASLLSRRAKRLYWLLPVLVIASPAAGYAVFVVGMVGAVATAGTGQSAPSEWVMAVTMGLGCGLPVVCLVAAMVLIWHVFLKTREVVVEALREQERRGTGDGVGAAAGQVGGAAGGGEGGDSLGV